MILVDGSQMLITCASNARMPTAGFVVMTRHVIHVKKVSGMMSTYVRHVQQNVNNVKINTYAPTARKDTFLRMICALRVTRVVMNAW